MSRFSSFQGCTSPIMPARVDRKTHLQQFATASNRRAAIEYQASYNSWWRESHPPPHPLLRVIPSKSRSRWQHPSRCPPRRHVPPAAAAFAAPSGTPGRFIPPPPRRSPLPSVCGVSPDGVSIAAADACVEVVRLAAAAMMGTLEAAAVGWQPQPLQPPPGPPPPPEGLTAPADNPLPSRPPFRLLVRPSACATAPANTPVHQRQSAFNDICTPSMGSSGKKYTARAEQDKSRPQEKHRHHQRQPQLNKGAHARHPTLLLGVLVLGFVGHWNPPDASHFSKYVSFTACRM